MNPTEQCPDGSIRIDSREEWNDTGIDVVAGQAYRYSAEGVWCDAAIGTDADGFEKWYMWIFRRWRRARNEPWFRLIGMVDRRIQVRLGRAGEFKAPASGRLYCFSNDWTSKRGNNKGCVCLRIEKASPSATG